MPDNRVPAVGSPLPLRWLSVLFLLVAAGGWADAPALSADNDNPRAGYFQLSWQLSAEAGNGVFLLEQQGPSERHRWRVEGRRSYAVTGLADGAYRYRVRRLEPRQGSWSNSVSVVVEHHSVWRAWTFFVAGLIIFVALVAVIVANRRA